MRFDAIVIGAGHNGLVAAAYLARAGLRTVVLERRDRIGGACVTEELWPGHRISRAAYVAGLLRPALIRELGLEARGLRLLRRDPSSFTPLPDGRGLLLGPDPALCAREIGRFSTRDAERYADYERLLDRAARAFEPLLDVPPPDPARLALPRSPHRRRNRALAVRDAARSGAHRPTAGGAGARDTRSLVRQRAAASDARHGRSDRRLRGAIDAGHRLRALPPRDGRNGRRARRLGLRAGGYGRALGCDRGCSACRRRDDRSRCAGRAHRRARRARARRHARGRPQPRGAAGRVVRGSAPNAARDGRRNASATRRRRRAAQARHA